MRKFGLLILIFFVVIIIIPFLIVNSCNILKTETPKPHVIVEEEIIYVNVLDTKNDKAMKLELDEYIKGVVAAEMPVLFHLEALKAQSIAARTYTLNRLEEFGGKPDGVHPQYELCTDHRHCQAWISKEDRLSAWGKNVELSSVNNIELWSKIEEAVDSTKGLALAYNDKLIDPLYHSTSGGSTENSEDYFTSSLPYLRSVSSEYEKESPYMNTSFDISVSEFTSTIKKKYPDIKLDKSKMIDNIEILSNTSGGKVEKVRVGNKVLAGREMRELLGLRSSEFTIKQSGSTLVFTVVGYGHGVGLSQYGADGMANAGFKYKDILTHYFTGTEIKKMY
ncbi:stage II sporulation protein D [Alkalibaculum sp. M08DMB]|uniref:Stage II sporulation protein D n=1 Tax=Alkalibaculum sporogenes TaxID=2655001 RepID=A0A6A7KCG4_9FIRM|nr:stage II sporulation protein D [Alkalibaculum sporogenes]MPW26991.1 stage II sporulation protein D [Alkalibaculum sporogenes]